jgi:hypothetical protein
MSSTIRPSDIILGNKSYAEGRQNPILDLKYGGQMGFQPDYPSYLSNASYVKRNLIPFLIQAPRGFNDLDPTGSMIETLKSLVELHAKSIEGLQSTLRVEWAETPFGGAGEMQQDVTNVTRERSQPAFSWTEKYGKPINRFLDFWITGLLMDPNTKYPGVVMNNLSNRPTDLLPDYIAATMLFVEPDPTHTKVVEAWLCTNMMPETGGDNVGRRDLTAAGETIDYSVTFSAITQTGHGVRKFGQKLLDKLKMTNVNPNYRPAFVEDITADVAKYNGYSEAIASASQSAIRP